MLIVSARVVSTNMGSGIAELPVWEDVKDDQVETKRQEIKDIATSCLLEMKRITSQDEIEVYFNTL